MLSRRAVALTHQLTRSNQAGAAAAVGAVRGYGSERMKGHFCHPNYTGPDMSFDPPGRHHLFVPGPVNIPESVQRAMIRQSVNHRDPMFPLLTFGILEDIKKVYKSEKGTPFMFPSTGTGAWESALSNVLNAGDKVLMPRYGLFSHLWTDQARRLGLDVEVMEERWGNGADEARIEAALRADKDKKIKAVCIVHNETTTGVTSDLQKVREAIDSAGHPALLIVDGISSIGACEFKFDEWGVDIAVTGSQKALSLPTGLSFVMASDKALEAEKTATLPRVFFSWKDMIKANAEGNFPYTPSIPLMYGLREQLDRMMAEGMDNVIARHNRHATAARMAVDAWGLKLLCENPRWYSNSLTVVRGPEGVDTTTMIRSNWAKYNLSLGTGLDEVKGKVFRIGHLGDMNEIMLLGALAGTEMGLMDMGYALVPGSGVGAATKYFQETSGIIKSREFMDDPRLSVESPKEAVA